MNSKLLEEAIIDAEALKEAALRNAEQAVLEKYAPEVRQAIETLLEQEDPAMMDPMMGQAPEEEMDVPLAATGGEKLCPCPDDEEVITISIGDLEKAISDIARANKVPQEEPPMDAGMDMGMEMGAEQPAPEEELPPEEAPPALQEELQLDEELLSSILEELDLEEEVMEEKFDAEMDTEEKGKYKGKSLEDLRSQLKSLKDSGPHKEGSPEFEKMNELEFAIRAKTGWGKVDEEEKEMMQENKSLSSQNSKLLVERKKTLNENRLLTEQLTKLLEQHNRLLEENKEFKATLTQVSQRLEETNLMNAKLFYKNQALGSDSLNERQKNKIVEAVSQAGSVDEAKMIYETLCSAVGSFEKKGPQSLSEAVETRSSLVMKGRQQNNTGESNPLYNKWQKIAGIKK